jgi:hypothetical protein
MVRCNIVDRGEVMSMLLSIQGDEVADACWKSGGGIR